MIEVTCLIDNSTFRNGVYAQQGLSLFVEVFNKRILFDTGQSYEVLKYNSEVLKVDIHNLDIIIISHKDFDHIGALAKLVENLQSQPDIYFADDYVYKGQPINKMISEKDWSIIANYPKLHEITDAIKITSDIFLTKPQQADVKEIALVVKESSGAVVFVGCSHPGIDLMIENAKEVIGEDKIRGVIGGFHMVFASEIDVEKKVDYLKKQNLEFIACMHCTGYKAVSRLFQDLPEILKVDTLGTLGVGNRIEIAQDIQLKTVNNKK